MIALALVAAALAADCPDWAPGWNAITVDGERREVWAALPATSSGPAPLLVAFNGTTEDGRRFAHRARLQELADRGVRVLAPSSAGHGELWPVWDAMRSPGQEEAPNADLALFDALVDCELGRGAADPERVWVAGHSAGGSMTNHVLQRRAELLAGAVVGSGVFGNTSPKEPDRLEGRVVVVTIGGRDDVWSGRAGGVRVRDFAFESEAVAAGRFYAAQGAELLSCEGDGLGHAWLDALNPWMAELMLSRRRGQVDLAPLPAGEGLPTCARAPLVPTPGEQLACEGADNCAPACQLFADCAVENRTVGPVLRQELGQLGFEDRSCGGCLARCAASATPEVDDLVLACFAEHQRQAMCADGVAGARPLIDAVNLCCAGVVSGSSWCQQTCAALRGNSAARGYFTVCR